MKFLVNLMLTTFVICIIAMSYLPSGNARALASSVFVERFTNQNTTTAVDQDKSLLSNHTAVTVLPAQTKPLGTSQPAGGAAVARIKRQDEETEVVVPFDLHALHLPCDLDQAGSKGIIDFYPKQCIWMFYLRHTNEEFFRLYKTYQLEAFFFGHYYERMKRFEMDPHIFDYSNIVV